MKYKLINNLDGNDVFELKSTKYVDALEEVLKYLGWYLTESEEE